MEGRDQVSIRKSIYAYVKSMRLYYAFITGIAGWIGVSFYNFCMPEQFDYARSGIILAMLFLSWGVNQIINDYLGLPEDRINAPNRPMVTGELYPLGALLTSIVLMVGVTIVAFFLNSAMCAASLFFDSSSCRYLAMKPLASSYGTIRAGFLSRTLMM